MTASNPPLFLSASGTRNIPASPTCSDPATLAIIAAFKSYAPEYEKVAGRRFRFVLFSPAEGNLETESLRSTYGINALSPGEIEAETIRSNSFSGLNEAFARFPVDLLIDLTGSTWVCAMAKMVLPAVKTMSYFQHPCVFSRIDSFLGILLFVPKKNENHGNRLVG